MDPADGFPYYLELTKNRQLDELFSDDTGMIFLKSIPEHKLNYRYAPGKWSVKQVVGHMTDHERIKMNRAFLFSRKLDVQLWGYDEKSFIQNSNFENLDYRLIIQDFINVRKASVSFINTLSADHFNYRGNAGNYVVTMEDFLKTIIGHEIHHIKILKEKYNI